MALSQGGVAALVAALHQVQGATFASLDAETFPKKGSGLIKFTTNQQVLLVGGAGEYESIVKKRLEEAGLNPGDFAVMDLPWGTRVDDTPLISHKSLLYLQCIVTHPGGVVYKRQTPFGDREVDPSAYGIKANPPNQGLPEGQGVVVNTYNLDNLTSVILGGFTFT